MKSMLIGLMLLMVLPTMLLAQEELGAEKLSDDKADRQPSLSDSVVNEPTGDVEPLADPAVDSEPAKVSGSVAIPNQEVMPEAVPQATSMASPIASAVSVYSQAASPTVVWGSPIMAECCGAPAAIKPTCVARPVCQPCAAGITNVCPIVCEPVKEAACCCHARKPRRRLLQRIGCRR